MREDRTAGGPGVQFGAHPRLERADDERLAALKDLLQQDPVAPMHAAYDVSPVRSRSAYSAADTRGPG